MDKTYEFTVQGTAANGQTWTTEGVVRGDFARIFEAVMRQSFDQLTSGKAVFGLPGVGCNGPYDVSRVLIRQRKNDE